MRTSLNQIRAHNPCRAGWEKLLRGLGKTAADDAPLWIDTVIDHNDLDDALWCLRSVEGCEGEIRLYAVWCAWRVWHLMNDPRSVAALNVAERYARGEASDEELSAAAWAAEEAMWEAATAEEAAAWAASTAAWAAAAAAEEAAPASWAASTAAWAAVAARNTERAAQAEELRRVCREMREAKP
jgi:hypothetical protein